MSKKTNAPETATSEAFSNETINPSAAMETIPPLNPEGFNPIPPELNPKLNLVPTYETPNVLEAAYNLLDKNPLVDFKSEAQGRATFVFLAGPRTESLVNQFSLQNYVRFSAFLSHWIHCAKLANLEYVPSDDPSFYMRIKTKVISTSDLALAAFLTAKDLHELETTQFDGAVFFNYQSQKSIQEIIDQFNNGIVNISSFSTAFQNLQNVQQRKAQK